MEDELQDNLVNPKELQDRSLQVESHARRARAVYLAEQRKEETVKAEPVVKDPGKGPEPVREEEPLVEMPREPEPKPEKAKPFLRSFIGATNPSIQDNDPSNDTFGIEAMEKAERETGLTRQEIFDLAMQQGLNFTPNFKAQYGAGIDLSKLSSANIQRSTPAPAPAPTPTTPQGQGVAPQTPSRSGSIYSPSPASGSEPFLRSFIGSTNPSIQDKDPSNDTFGVEALNAAMARTGMSEAQILGAARRQGLQLTTKLKAQVDASSRSIY
jgi:hypothetical protein